MTQAGGPAAINGFLYQIIHHLRWLADVTLSGTLDGQVIEDACLILEPRDGGDARAEAYGTYLVEQYKTRKDGTWSISDIVQVLCNLRKAVPSPRPVNARYRFVTDGCAGRLDQFDAFLADVKSVARPDDLDNTEEREFRKGLSATNRKFFERVVAETQSGLLQSNEEDRTAVFHLLFRFEMEFGADAESRVAEVERLFRLCGPDLGDERKIRERLVGVLFEMLSRGEERLDARNIDAMFHKVGLMPKRLRRIAELPEKMSTLTHQRFVSLKYKSDQDVRGIPEWPGDKPVLVIAGESGTGKTWQLGRLLEACGQDRQVATFVHSAKTAEELKSSAARDVWQTVLGETSDKTIIAVMNFLRELAPNAPVPVFTVALDDVQSIDLARDLVRQDWEDWGMRLVITAPQAVARALQITDSKAIHVHTVGDFSVDELDTLIKHRGGRWAYLPPDLKILLRKPILAGLFLELPYTSIQHAPCSEYEIFENFWQRIAAKGHSGDEGIVIALAAHMHQGKPYPLPRPEWRGIGLDSEEAASRLEAVGWFRTTEDGEVAFAHDRLLNWAVAKSLVRQFQRKDLSIEGLGAILAGEVGEAEWHMRGRLGYVPMDVLWLLAADDQNMETLGRLTVRMEDSHEFGSYGEEIYVHLLPTLGQRAVPILLERLSAITDSSDGGYRAGQIGKAFAALTRQRNIKLQVVIDSLVHAPTRIRQAVAIAALTAEPDVRHIDRLWELHQQRLCALEDRTDGSRRTDYNASFAALRAGVAMNPGWLRNRIISAEAEKEHVSELGYLLNGLEHADAPRIWKETGNILMVKVSTDKPRSLLYCIARFADHKKLEFVIQHLSRSEDFASGAALAALSVLDPRAAVERLVEVQDSERYLTRDQWLPALLYAEPELTRWRIRELAESDQKEHCLIEHLFWERPDEIDETMLHFVLSAFARNLRKHLDEAVVRDPSWLFHPLDFLGRIARLELLTILEAQAGEDLERMITAVACSRLRTNSNCRDHVLESARRVLILMGGDGITTLVNRELESEHFWVRHGGLNWALLCSDNGTIGRLASIARRPVPRDGNGKPQSDAYQEFYQATSALAALGADETLVEAVQHSDIAEVPVDLAELRAYRGPMPKALTDQARRILQSTAPNEDALLTALIIAWVSYDPDMILPVRTVLKRADPEGKIAAYACIALQALGDSPEDFAQLALRLVHTEANSVWGQNALFCLGEHGLELLGKWLEGRSAMKRTDSDDLVIRALYDNPITRKLSIEAAVNRCLPGQFLLDAPYDIAAEANEPALREQILDKAFATRSVVTTQPLRAIEGLAKFDVERAVEAIELGLQLHIRIERQLCRLLVRIAPDMAAAKLIDAAVSGERGSLKRAVGQALRRLDPGVVSCLVIERMSGSASGRKAAAELAGWLPIPAIKDALGRLADNDNVMEVRLAALAALKLHRQETNVQSLLAAFPSAACKRQWSLLIAILDAADPYLLTEREDPLWLGNILSDVPAAFAHHAKSVLRKRKQKDG